MADHMTVEIDASEVLRMLDTLDDRVEARLKAVSRVTAEAIRREGRARLARQTSGTGATAEAITIDEIETGYRVYVGPVSGRAENVPLWLEMGTKHMTSRPFLFSSARLEEGPHLRRVAEALQDAIDEAGG